VEAEDDKHLPEAGKNRAAEGTADDGNAIERIEHDTQKVGDKRRDGADDQVGQRNHDGEGAGGNEEELDVLGEVLTEVLLELCGNPDGKDDGNDGAGIARRRHDDWNAEDRRVVAHGKRRVGKHRAKRATSGYVHHTWIRERDAQGHADELARAELFGGRITQDDGQEVEEAIARSIQDLVDAIRLGNPAQEHSDGQDALDHARRAEYRQNRLDDTRDEVDQRRGNAAFLGRSAVLVDLT